MRSDRADACANYCVRMARRYVGAALPVAGPGALKSWSIRTVPVKYSRPPGQRAENRFVDVHLQPRIHERCTSIDEHLKPIGSKVLLFARGTSGVSHQLTTGEIMQVTRREASGSA